MTASTSSASTPVTIGTSTLETYKKELPNWQKTCQEVGLLKEKMDFLADHPDPTTISEKKVDDQLSSLKDLDEKAKTTAEKVKKFKETLSQDIASVKNSITAAQSHLASILDANEKVKQDTLIKTTIEILNSLGKALEVVTYLDSRFDDRLLNKTEISWVYLNARIHPQPGYIAQLAQKVSNLFTKQ